MQATMDSAGRLVIPKQLRTEIGLPSGGPVDIEAADGELTIRPRGSVRLQRDEYGLLVMTADVPIEELPTVDDLLDILDDLRQGRLR